MSIVLAAGLAVVAGSAGATTAQPATVVADDPDPSSGPTDDASSPDATAALPQASDPFYTPPSPLPSKPGTLIRSEDLGVDVPGGTGLRILYVSERPDGTPVASSGMVFIPDSPAPPGGRKVVAWAHPTVGMGDNCAPSRRPDPIAGISTWIGLMMAQGWVVTATDYAGLGTPGPELYLVGQAEAADVVYSVRAARQLDDADADNEFIVWGHSQGGHSALWTGSLAESLAPELQLDGVAAAAPAAELNDIMGAQYDTAVAWVIGPEVMVSWPIAYPGQNFNSVLSLAAKMSSSTVAKLCIEDAAVAGTLANYAKLPYFTSDPTQDPAWQSAGDDQTPPPLPNSMPLMLVQSTTDAVVLAWPNAKLQDDWCDAGSSIMSMWVSGIGHMKTALDMGPSVVTWIAERFYGRSNPGTCNVPPAVDPNP